MSRRGATSLAGVLLLDKPAGLTSHDVVAEVRRATGEGRVGHAGTLDPMATGLLVVLIGPYTRLEPYLSGAEKRYDATIAFGSETDTDDADGEVTRRAEVPAAVSDAAAARAVLASMVGPSLQTPPAYSAIKVGGKIAHRAARAGSALDLAARPIEVTSAGLLAVHEAAWDVRFHVSKGTYVRALARDLGRTIGSAAHLSALRRTGSGVLTIDDAHDLDDMRTAASEGGIVSLFHDPIIALDLPVVEGDPRVLDIGGRLPAAPGVSAGTLVAVTAEGELRGVYRADGDGLTPQMVLPRRSAS